MEVIVTRIGQRYAVPVVPCSVPAQRVVAGIEQIDAV